MKGGASACATARCSSGGDGWRLGCRARAVGERLAEPRRQSGGQPIRDLPVAGRPDGTSTPDGASAGGRYTNVESATSTLNLTFLNSIAVTRFVFDLSNCSKRCGKPSFCPMNTRDRPIMATALAIGWLVSAVGFQEPSITYID